MQNIYTTRNSVNGILPKKEVPATNTLNHTYKWWQWQTCQIGGPGD